MPRARLAAILGAMLALACSRPSESPARQPELRPASDVRTGVPVPPEPSGSEPPTATPSASDAPPAPPGSASDKPAPEACMKECLARDQMRAEPAEKIDRDCRSECQ